MTVLAEGIETQAQLERLRHLRCEAGQGPLFSPAVRLARWRPCSARRPATGTRAWHRHRRLTLPLLGVCWPTRHKVLVVSGVTVLRYPRNSAYARNQTGGPVTPVTLCPTECPDEASEKAIPTHRTATVGALGPGATCRQSVMTSFQWPGSFTPASTHQASCASISADEPTPGCPG